MVLAGSACRCSSWAAWAARDAPAPSGAARRRCAAPCAPTARLLRDRTFVGLVLVAGLAMAGAVRLRLRVSSSPGASSGWTSSSSGWLFGAGAAWLIGATQLNPVLLRRLEPRRCSSPARSLGHGRGAALVVLAATGTGGLAGVVVPLWAVLFAGGLALPNAPALALSRHGEAAGTAAALLGAIQFGVGAVVSPLVGVLGNDAGAIGTVVVTSLVLAIVVLVAGGPAPAGWPRPVRRRETSFPRTDRHGPHPRPVVRDLFLVKSGATSHDGCDMSHWRRSVPCPRS